jgi:hypothetical protein
MVRGRGQNAWAELGAATRLEQIDRERVAILKAFPRLRRKAMPTPLSIGARPRRTISAAARRAMSAGMKRFWAKRKAQAQAKTKTTN